MIVQVVRTPVDLERTLEADLCRVNHWIDGQARHEGAVIEQILGQAFTERGWAGSGGLVDPFEAIAEPLHRLYQRGLQLVAVLSRGRYALPSWDTSLREIGFELTDYLVAPDPCYFRSARAAFETPVHVLGRPCSAGHAAIVSEPAAGERQRAFHIWTSTESVLRDFEQTVPWCARCSPDVTRPVG
ncbi:MAG: hypothetical protein ACREKJ_14720 [Candidatus Rokuibacteriota bacterium]